jgi:hypothetical protein
MTSMPPAIGSMSPAIKGWSRATGSSRSSGWKNSLHSTGRNRPGTGLIGRKGRPEDGCLLTRETGIDQRQPVVALDQEGVCKPHRDDVHTFDHTIHGHYTVNVLSLINAVLLAGDNPPHIPAQASSMAGNVQREILRAIRVSFPIKRGAIEPRLARRRCFDKTANVVKLVKPCGFFGRLITHAS